MKKIVFLTGTRADFGKLKSLIKITQQNPALDSYIFCTGMHMNPLYGGTHNEVVKSNLVKPKNLFSFYNHYDSDTMDNVLAQTIDGFSRFVKDVKPDLIVVHGDRVEALAGAIVGSCNNILVAHIEGGELSGTIDDSIRHGVTKMCHVHFVANKAAKKRLLQMGESENSIFIIGSPDLDIMLSDKLPALNEVKKYYEIPFNEYALLLFHPVTTEVDTIAGQADQLISAAIKSGLNYVVIKPNNDMGSSLINATYYKLDNNPRFKMFPSVKFESFITLLKNCKFIIGNSSAGIREAPYFNVPTINVGTRQTGRQTAKHVLHCHAKEQMVTGCIKKALTQKITSGADYGTGDSDKRFLQILCQPQIWQTNKQKKFVDQ